ncbi:MAG: ComEC/Rec2 family competence protein [bacterium]|nr:ComEC/Rec2 family competence protein [bacterium]
MRKSTFFFLACLSFILGIALHSLVSPDKRIVEPFLLYGGFLGFASIGIVVYIMTVGATFRSPWQTKVCRYGFLFLALISLGLFRYAQIIPVVDKGHISFYVGHEITVQGTVDNLPRVREKTVAYVVKVAGVRSAGVYPPQAAHLPAGKAGKVPRYKVAGKLMLTSDRLPEYRYGDVLTFTCTPTALNEYEQYARKDGVSASCAFPRQITSVPPLRVRGGEGELRAVSLRTALYAIRERVHLQLTSLFPEPYGGLLAGILYGDTSGISSSLKESFRISGLAHITALSGYNISIMSRVLMDALIFLLLTRVQALPVALLVIAGFVMATGAEASVVRAAIMGSLVAIAKGVGRLAKMQNALAFAAAVMLGISPSLLRFDLGFALSFLSTIALLVFSEPIARRTFFRYIPSALGLRDAAASSAAALIITLPLILYAIGKIGPFSLLVNILVVPAVPFAMGLGSIAVAVDFVFHPGAVPIAWATRLLLGYIISLAEYFARFGAFQIRLNAFFAVILFLSVVGGLSIWMRRKEVKKTPRLPRVVHPFLAQIVKIYSKWRAIFRALYRAIVPLAWRKKSVWIALGIIATVILAGQFFFRREPPLAVYFYDIGQGDGFLIRTADGFDVLIDGGPTDRIVEKLGRTLPFWDKTIELMVLTHPHADHVVGLTAVLKRFKVEKVLATGVLHTTDEYIAWLQEIKKQGIQIETPKDVAEGFSLPNGDLKVSATLKILWPEQDFTGKRVKEGKIGEGGGLNDTSVVMKLTFGNTSFLLMGDATSNVEEELVQACQSQPVISSESQDEREISHMTTKHGVGSLAEARDDEGCMLQSDVLKVGHHGSKYSSSREFLEEVKPKYAVIQSGQNRYGHPAYSTLWRLKQAGIEVLRNDKDGDVVFESDGSSIDRR